jgi:hypothetical protein
MLFVYMLQLVLAAILFYIVIESLRDLVAMWKAGAELSTITATIIMSCRVALMYLLVMWVGLPILIGGFLAAVLCDKLITLVSAAATFESLAKPRTITSAIKGGVSKVRGLFTRKEKVLV